MQTMDEFVRKHGITMQCDPIPRRTDGLMEELPYHWDCALTRRGSRKAMAVYFSMGSGHHGRRPHVAEVLEAIQSDASGFLDVRDFYEWADEYGYGPDPDDLDAQRTFEAVGQQAAEIADFLGDELFEEFMTDVREA